MTPFALDQPATLREAVALLDADDPTVRPLSGGTALMLMMKAGVFKPSRLVSLHRVEKQYSAISADADGALHIGALATLAALERSDAARQACPVIATTLHTLANIRVRNVATVGGSLAHADPHMDLPPVLLALDATVNVIGPGGGRTIAMGDLHAGYFETTLARDELISGIVVPAQSGRRAAYSKISTRSAHDWPALGVAVSLDIDGGTVRLARIVVSAATERPIRASAAEKLLIGKTLDDQSTRAAADAAADEVELISDARGSAAYKQQLVRVHVARTLAKALRQEGQR